MNRTAPGNSLRSFLLMATFVVCVGCSGEIPRLSGPQLEAINHNMRGIKAEARENHELALEEFNESLKVNSALDNVEGRIVALVNITRVSRRIADLDRARTAIDQAVQLTPPQSPLFGEVAFEKSSVELAGNNLPQAQDWANKAVAASEEKRKAAAVGLLALIFYREKLFGPATAQAEKALALSRQNDHPEEEANALRLLGFMHNETGHSKEAIDALGRALELDKRLGKSKKIAADLQGLADAHVALKQNGEALDYYRRALSVNRNNGDTAQAAQNLLHLANLLDSMGQRAQSAELLQEREGLLKATLPR